MEEQDKRSASIFPDKTTGLILSYGEAACTVHLNAAGLNCIATRDLVQAHDCYAPDIAPTDHPGRRQMPKFISWATLEGAARNIALAACCLVMLGRGQPLDPAERATIKAGTPVGAVNWEKPGPSWENDKLIGGG